MFLQLTLNGVLVGGVYALIAVGFVLIFKASGVFNLAQGQMLALGALVCWSFITELEFALWIGFTVTLVFAIFMGLAIERIAIRPLIGESAFTMVMATLALSILLTGIGTFKWGSMGLGRFPNFLPSGAIDVGEIFINQKLMWAFIVAIIVVVALTIYFARTKGGLGMKAVAEDQQTALSAGISVKRIVALTWVMAAVISTVGGVLIGTFTGVSLELATVGLIVLPVVMLGGLDSIPGAIVAGLVIGVAESLSAGYLEPIIGLGFKGISPYIILLIVLMIRPRGLFGMKEIERI